MIGTIIPQVQSAATRTLATANAIRNLTQSLSLSLFPPNIWATVAKDIGEFEFDYIGEQTLDAGSDVTEHFTEDNNFYNDHIALKPIILTCRGFVSDVAQTKRKAVGLLGSITAALSPMQPYMTKYAPGAASKMGSVLNVATSIEQQANQALATYNSASNFIKGIVAPTACEKAYKALNALRISQNPVMVVTPFELFGVAPAPGFAVTNVRMVAPDNTRTTTDIMVTLKEMRFAKTISTAGLTSLGTVSK